MKILVYLLLLANLSVFVWHFRWSGDAQRPAVAESTDTDSAPRLVLYREYRLRPEPVPAEPATEPEQAVESATDIEEPEEVVATVAARQCFTLGPFARQADAKRVSGYLDELGINAARRMTKDKTRKGYWVFLPPAESRVAARETLARLKAQNVKDYFRVVTGAQKNAISLGVFSRSDLAQRRLRAMRKQGFEPRIDTVDLPRRQYWLDWPVPGNPTLSDGDLVVLRDANSGMGYTEQTCPQP